MNEHLLLELLLLLFEFGPFGFAVELLICAVLDGLVVVALFLTFLITFRIVAG
jgi:hypothetical protein